MTIRTLLAILCCALPLSAQSVFPVRDVGEGRDRTYDVLHYRIQIRIDDRTKEVVGRVTTTLVPFLANLYAFEFDAEQMDIHRVTLGGKDLRFEARPKTVAITLDRPYSYRDTLTVAVDYSCRPTKGLYFVQPDSAIPGKPRQIWTQGEDMDNHFWFPCYDYPNDRATSEVIVTVPAYYTALSNGRLLGVTENRAEKTKTFHWKESKPHVSYLVMLAIGEYAVLRDTVGTLPLEYYVYPHHTADAKICFAETPQMIRFFGERTGIPYPWEKYAQVLIKDFVVGGMENTSATSLADEATVFDARARLDDSPQSLIAHELSHQWWGDLLTCKDWRHLWLNESFASYFDPLWFEYSAGRDEFDYLMYQAQLRGIGVDKRLGRKPIVSVGSYGENVYPRGASVLHMARFVLGDELFWRGIRHYIRKHQYGVVETNDLKVAFEEATGQNLHWFFDQWVYKAGYPIFDVRYAWDDSARSVLLHVAQVQTRDSLTGVFRTPVEIGITTPAGETVHRMNILSAETTFVLPAPAPPALVIFDRGNWLLKELRFAKSDAEWLFQAETGVNPVDRLRAIEVIGAKRDSIAALPALSRIALRDSYWAVRQEAVRMLGRWPSRDSSAQGIVRSILLAALRDPRSSVRSAAIDRLAEHPSSEVSAALREALRDSSYRVVAASLRALGRTDSTLASDLLSAHLTIPSHRDAIASAAFAALARIDTARGLVLAVGKITYGNPSPLRWTAFDIIVRHARKHPASLSHLLPLTRDPDAWLRISAVRTFGEIGDASILPLLDGIAAEKGNRAADAAAESARRIRTRLAPQ